MVRQHIPLKGAGLKTEWVAYREKILWERRGTDGDFTDYYYAKCTEKEIVLNFYSNKKSTDIVISDNVSQHKLCIQSIRVSMEQRKYQCGI